MAGQENHVMRRLNLLSLLREFAHRRLAETGETTGAEAAFAKRIGISPSMLSQIKTHRPIGSKVARQIEATLEIEAGWLDVERALTSPVTPQQLKFERLAHKIWTEGNAKQKREAISALIKIIG